MSNQSVKARVANLYLTASEWASQNPVLNAGELGIESDTGKFKIGDGANTWNDLSYNSQESSVATSSSLGGIRIGYTESGKNYPVELNSSNQAYVNVPWTDTNTTYSNATTSTAGLMSSSDKAKLDGIASGANKYTLPAATSGALGGVRIGYVESGKNYPVELNSSSQMFVNVPWTDTNTNYYPTTFKWSNGTSAGPTGSLTGSGMSAVSISAIPSASSSQSGVVTTGTQTFAGAKTFSNTITGSISGNAGTATKLQTARTITLGTGVSSTATSFSGASDITIPVTGIKEAYLTWGGKNFTGSYGPIDAAMIPDLGANRFMFLKPEGITIEYSTNGGSSWTDYGATDSQKRGLFARGESLTVGKATSSSPATANSLLRVTIDTGKAGVYTVLNKFMVYCSTNGSSGSYVTIEKALQSTPTTYTNVASKVSLAGWAGYNIINVPGFTTYGNSASSQYGRIRFTFGITSQDASYPGLSIGRIAAFGGVGWTTPSTMASNGHLYSFDNDLNATFPANVKAESFTGSLKGNASTASALATARTISLTGDVTGSVSFNGSSNVSITTTVADSSHNHNASNITAGTLPVARGGTGIGSNPSVLTNLGSTTAASVFQSAPRPGITGTLAISHGGTGATTAEQAKKNLGLESFSYSIITSRVTGTNPITISGYSSTYDTVLLYRNGFYMKGGGTEYSISSNGTVTFASGYAANSSDVHDVVVLRASSVTPDTDTIVTESRVKEIVDQKLSSISSTIAIENTTDSTSTTTGALKVAGGVGISKTLRASSVYGAVWNDLADAMEVPEDTELEAGRCYLLSDEGCYLPKDRYGVPVIHSDTFGFLMGEKEGKKCINAAVAGFVLAFVDKPYRSGTPLTYSDDGSLTVAGDNDLVVGLYYKQENEPVWNGVEVNNRHWIRVR